LGELVIVPVYVDDLVWSQGTHTCCSGGFKAELKKAYETRYLADGRTPKPQKPSKHKEPQLIDNPVSNFIVNK